MTKTAYLYLFAFSFCFLHANDGNFCNELKAINAIVASSHYQPKAVNDSLSKGVFWLFLDHIDEDKRFFLQSDMEVLQKDEFYLDNYLKDAYCDFLDGYVEILEQRITETKEILESLRNIPLDYSGKDSLNYSAKKDYKYFKDKAAAERYWNKRVRYKLLRKLVENDSVLEHITSSFKTLEEETKQKIIDNEICLLTEFEQSKGTIRRLVEASFLDAFVKYQDPNSTYLSSSDKTLFEQSVSISQLSFGIQTTKRKNGDIVISYISPGSSAFKNGGFEVEDVILSLSNSKTTIETYCTSNATITSFINDEHTDNITFKIKKKDGQIKSIKLGKSNLQIEDNSITGYILETDKKIGYIKVPSFYTDTESINGLGVANDVSKQIYRLVNEDIKGLVLDLRFNGGGSMKEAAELSGMFIDRGPVAISKVRGEQSYTIRDPNRGTVFTKPIVVLVDQFSASASEFFSGAMQDYNRAIIVGSITHGKATSQIIGPIADIENTNFIKLTTGQFFRVTGKSHQQIGVVPDIILPNVFDGYKTQEVHEPFSMANSEVEVTMKHKPKLKRDISLLQSNSKKRVAKSSAFKAIKNFNNEFVNGYINRTGTYPLTLDFIYNDNANYNQAWKTYSDALDQNQSTIKVLNTKSTEAVLAYNSEYKNTNEQTRASLAQDPYVQEAFYILNDILNPNPN